MTEGTWGSKMLVEGFCKKYFRLIQPVCRNHVGHFEHAYLAIAFCSEVRFYMRNGKLKEKFVLFGRFQA